MFDELTDKLDSAVRKLRGMGKITEKNISDSMREIRRILLEADVNYRVAKEFIDTVKEKAVGEKVFSGIAPGQQVVKIVYDELVRLLGSSHAGMHLDGTPPAIIMVTGLQGSGKTTFSGKLAKYLIKGHSPMLVAADIYRPAAIDQLRTLGENISVPVFEMGTEKPVSIVVNAVKEARAKGCDVLVVDTAGRLHIDEEMMSELKTMQDKIKPSEILFVADSMTGQDAVKSAQRFQENLNLTGIVLTKLDGDSKGGAALSMRSVTGLPVKFVSNGEKPDDLQAFYPDRMASRILGMGDVLTLVEKAKEAADSKVIEKLERKKKGDAFTFTDFLDQLQQIKKMGPVSQIAGMIPGMKPGMKGLDVDESALGSIEAIINSMTFAEREKPHIINGSRRKRIASGSGTAVQDVNRLLKQFQMMQKMLKQMSRFRNKNMFGGIPAGF